MVKKNNISEQDKELVISYKKDRCRGNVCPQYSISIFNNQSVVYEGLANMPVIGIRKNELSDIEYQKVITAFENSSFPNFEKEYTGRIRDLPRTIMKYKDYEINYQEMACPAKLKPISKMIEGFIPKD